MDRFDGYNPQAVEARGVEALGARPADDGDGYVYVWEGSTCRLSRWGAQEVGAAMLGLTWDERYGWPQKGEHR